ncbi:NADH:ubiquinone oxidoreductase ESSS subunit [Penicillium brevicompactum]|uniref:NADH:ubiquinone oxidoreductase ESSS subunit n=1 Tax=Penicillium brevicompactum TaxID=5074 RepID=UPI0025426A6B|nr:NADH:ubiquinone oxidoreductase ESSS subunit [Penicillium brevicompactum]KAJ5333233.1 NADH:ubiquinone oxidoreductase ESSS subunit [Penicillium brevicompactum]
MIARPMSHALRARCLLRTPQTTKAFSTQPILRAADHGDHYDPPDRLAVRRQARFLVAGVAYVFKPDTSIQTWALEEARRRLEAEGILEDPAKVKK